MRFWNVVKWILIVVVPLGAVAYFLPTIMKVFKVDPTSWFKSDAELAAEQAQEAANAQNLKQALKYSKNGRDYVSLADDIEEALSGWGYNWEKINSLIRGNRLNSGELDILFFTFGERTRILSWEKLNLAQWFKVKCSDAHYTTLKAFWAKSVSATNF